MPPPPPPYTQPNTGETTWNGYRKPHALASSWMLSSIGLGLVLYGLIILVFTLLKRAGVDNWVFGFTYERLFMRGSIPHIMTLGLTIGLSLLLIRLPLLRLEFRRLTAWSDQLGMTSGPATGNALEAVPGGPANTKTLVDQTIHQIFVRSTTAENRSEMDGVVDQIASVERRKLDASHVPVRYLIWLIPTLGFLGTVLGISLAVSGFSEVITQSQGKADVNSNLVEICNELGVAFDTTFVALIYSSLIALLMAYVDRYELGLLNAIDEFYALRIRPRLVFAARPEGAPAAEAGPAMAYAGTPVSGAVVVLQSPDGAQGQSLADVAKQVVAESLASLSADGKSIASSLTESGVAIQLKHYIETNLVHIQQQLNWMQTSAINKEDIQHLSNTFASQANVLADLIKQDMDRQAHLSAVLDKLAAVAEKLHTDGVTANVAISSVVSTPGRG